MARERWYVVIKTVDGIDLYWTGSNWTSAGQVAKIYRDNREVARVSDSMPGTRIEIW